MRLVNFSLLLVVALDVMGQGLMLPIVNTLVMVPDQSLLAVDTPKAARQFYFGLVIGVFFLSWFLGAPYISKLSDTIGRKEAILICLSGAFAGYVLTILALVFQSFLLLILSRVVSGFTAGNQPIAQAALVDRSADEETKTRYMGLVLVAVSLGLMTGPLLGGLLSDRVLLGDLASLALPFYAAAALILLNMALILVYFHNQPFERQPYRFRPTEVLLTLWQITKRPVVLKLAIVFFWSQMSLLSYYIFMDNYFFDRFGFDTLQNSITLVIFGAAMGLVSAFLVGPLNKRFGKKNLIVAMLGVMAVSVVLFLLNSSPILAYVLIVPFIAGFAIYYPTMLTLFSASVGPDEQGWVMGVTVAMYTLGGGLISLIGGELTAIDIRMPFFVSLGSLVLAYLLILWLWRGDDIAKLDPRPDG